MADRIALPERFWERVDMNGPVPRKRPSLGPCWLWTGPTNPKTGYGDRIAVGGEREFPHRVVYRGLIGPIPDDLETDHVCHSSDPAACPEGTVCLHRRCVNFDHLELVTHAENCRRAQRDACRKGHPMTGDNLYIVPRTGERRCRECNAQIQRDFHAKRLAADAKPPADARCKYGHPYDVDSKGRWFCRECARTRAREWKRRKRAG
jgi:hypothetical protein